MPNRMSKMTHLRWAGSPASGFQGCLVQGKIDKVSKVSRKGGHKDHLHLLQVVRDVLLQETYCSWVSTAFIWFDLNQLSCWFVDQHQLDRSEIQITWDPSWSLKLQAGRPTWRAGQWRRQQSTQVFASRKFYSFIEKVLQRKFKCFTKKV